MKGLHRKLLRDVGTLRWQLASIALVVASGIQALVAPLGTYRSVESARARFYDETAFADVFVHLTRAPDAVAEELAALDGVAAVETRLSFDVPLELPEVREPMSGRVISLAPPSRPGRTRLVVLEGRLPERGARGEAAVNEAFARARHLTVGDRVGAVLNGRREDLTLVGLVVSAEHIAALRPGEVLPDDAHFGVLWLSHEDVASRWEARGTFDEAVLWLSPGAHPASVLRRVDEALTRYGGYGAYAREDQPAHRFVDGELRELEVEATVLPVIFLGVAAFLVNVVLGRMVAQERTQIATLRALGFRVGPIVRHYLGLAAVVVSLGAVLGVPLGIAMGVGMTHIYTAFFRFPALAYEPEPGVIALAIGTSLAAAFLGGWAPARRIARMAPAEALQPPAPLAFHRGWLERWGIARRLPPSLRLVARNVVARPMRTLSAVSGVAAALGILVVGAFWHDAFVALLHHQFRLVQHEDATLALAAPAPERAVRELAHLPGVRLAEGLRTVPVRFRSARGSERSELLGLPADVTLRRLVDRDGRTVPMPREGLVLSRHLADLLRVGRGAHVTAEVLEGERPRLTLTVASVVDEPLGTTAYVDAEHLARLLGEGPTVSAVLLALEPGREREAHRALRGVPGVAAVALRAATVHRFESSMMEIVMIFSFVLTLLGAMVVVGVVYNTTRILVAERERELATLRVLGFTRGDISESVLLELAVQVLPALGVGAAFGYFLAAVAVRLFGPEDLSIPLVVEARTWAFCLAVVLAAAVASALAARRRLDRIDLVSVLKVRE